MSTDDCIRNDVIQQIMCHGSVGISTLEARHSIVFEDYFAGEIERLRTLQRDGLVELESGRLSLTAPGRLLMRAVAMVFDAYLNPVERQATMSRLV